MPESAVTPATPATPATVQPASTDDHSRIARLSVEAYMGDGLVEESYAAQLADVAGRARRAELLVARDRTGAVVGSVALVLSGDFGEILESEDEAAFRMLVVDPAARGQGIGELLVRECLDRARAAGKRRMVISTSTGMKAAHRIYERLGFTRLPERDWSPVPGVDLMVYVHEL